jgi:predicted Zn-dependent peptidase
MLTTQFKTNLIVFRFFSPIEASTAAAHALLPDVLLAGTKTHPTRRLLQQALEGLYDTRIRSAVMRLGRMRVTQFSVEYLDDAFAPVSVASQAIALLQDVLHDPLLLSPAFDEAILMRERRLMIEEMEASLENKAVVAQQAFKAIFFEGEDYGVDVDGTIETASEVTKEQLIAAYHEVMMAPRLAVSVGASDPAAWLSGFEAPRFPLALTDRTTTSRRAVTYHVKPSRFLQATVMIGYRTPICFDDALYYPMILADAILGGSQASLLFDQVREKHSLAYSVYSSYQGAKGVMLLNAGVDPEHVDQAATLMTDQVVHLLHGDFSDALFESAKKVWIQEVQTVYDTNAGTALKTIHDWSLDRDVAKEDAIQKMQAVSRQDVMNAAKTLRLDVVFAHSPKEVVWTFK